ncbi:MAG: hypothetical protein OXQ28_13980 [Acidobacteriota bacterium]|nr:hypothetical protein [Acidobacteriota bacterium]
MREKVTARDRDDPPPDAACDTWDEKERERAADACAHHAGVAPGEHEFTPW